MPIEGIDRRQLKELAEAGASVTLPAAVLLTLVVRVERPEEEIAELKRNSRNSSKPPSSDRNHSGKPEKKRKPRGRRKPEGQMGHRGKTLRAFLGDSHFA